MQENEWFFFPPWLEMNTTILIYVFIYSWHQIKQSQCDWDRPLGLAAAGIV